MRCLPALASVLAVIVGAGARPQPASPGVASSPSGLATGTAGMVSSAHPIATEAGLAILRSGGNAFDAAVAVASTLNVVEPAMSGIGGYGTILIYDASKRETRFLNPSGRIPLATNSEAFRPPTPNYLQNRRGAKAVSTPGNLHAWKAMSETYGSRPWATLFTPAIEAARSGFVLDARDAGTIKSAFESFPGHAKAFYGREGRPLAAGERLVQRDLARSLSAIAEGGVDVFYRGQLALAIDRTMAQGGGFLSAKDLEADVAEWWAPIRIVYRGHEVVTASPPANTFDFLVRLGMMSRFDVAVLGHNSIEYLHRFAEVTKHGFWTRLRYAGDPDVAPPPLGLLLSPDYWADQVNRIDLKRARPFVPPGLDGGALSHTTHFVVADRWGNVVSATQTLGNAFGSRLMPEGTGIWLNNSLAYCTFEPKGNPMDAHAGRRKLSGDCPTFIVREGRVRMAVGTPGGHTIGQTVPQMVMNLLDFRMDIERAIAAPRVSFIEPDVLAVEPGIDSAVVEGLKARGHNVRITGGLGNAHGLAIEYDAAGRVVRFTGAADPRGRGLARGY